MIKNTGDNKNYARTAQTLLVLNALTIILDVLWIITMRSVWSGKPSKNANAWKAFDFIRGFTLFLSFVNVVLKGVAMAFLANILRGAKA
jgi:hypothetical protein